MKQLIATFLFLTVGNSIFSQCVIDNSPSIPGVYPAMLGPGCVGVPYDQTTTFVFPADTLVLGFTVPVDSITLTVFNLPAGLTTVCQNPECKTIGNPPNLPRACMQVSGIPSAATSIGNFFIVTATYWVFVPFVGPMAFAHDINIGLDIYSQPDVSVTTLPLGLTSNSLVGTYQWLDCDNAMAPIPGETNPFFAPASSGNYAVEVTVTNGCTDTSVCTPFISSAGLEQLSTANFTVFPNPVNEQFTVVLSEVAQTVEMSVYSSIGQLITRNSFYTISSFESAIIGNSGIYFIELLVDGQPSRLKLIKR